MPSPRGTGRPPSAPGRRLPTHQGWEKPASDPARKGREDWAERARGGPKGGPRLPRKAPHDDTHRRRSHARVPHPTDPQVAGARIITRGKRARARSDGATGIPAAAAGPRPAARGPARPPPPLRRHRREAKTRKREGKMTTPGFGETTPPARPRAPERERPGAHQGHHGRPGEARQRAPPGGQGTPPPHRGAGRAGSKRTGPGGPRPSESCPLRQGIPKNPPEGGKSGIGPGSAPLNSTPGTRTRGGGGEARGPLAEREERSHPPGMSVPRLARLRPGPGERTTTTSIGTRREDRARERASERPRPRGRGSTPEGGWAKDCKPSEEGERPSSAFARPSDLGPGADLDGTPKARGNA